MRNGPRGSYKDGQNTYTSEMDRLLEQRPPVIRWRKNRRGVMVAVEVLDPHVERGMDAQAERAHASAGRAERAERAAAAEELEMARRRVVEAMQQEADEVTARFEAHRANNTPLLQAARTEI